LPRNEPLKLLEYEVIGAASVKKFGEASIVKAHGGQFVARRTNVTPVIGESPESVTVIMFESAEIPLRDTGSKFRSYIVEPGDMAQ